MSFVSLLTKLASVSGASAVALGAFGAHALKRTVTDPYLLGVWSTAAQYHLAHSVAALGVAAYAATIPTSSTARNPDGVAAAAEDDAVARAQRKRQRWGLRAAGYLFVTGNVLFSGSLYALVLTGHKALGAVTPVGGVAYIAGWLALGWSATAVGTPKRAAHHHNHSTRPAAGRASDADTALRQR